MLRNDWSKILGWPGYAVFQQEIDEKAKTLKLWVRRKRGNRRLICSACGRRIGEPVDTTEREVRDLPWGEFRTTVVIELYRVRCPDCGLKIEKVDQLPSKAPFSKRFEEAVGDQMKHRQRKGAQPAFHNHVAHLADGREAERFLDVVLRQHHRGAQDGRERAYHKGHM